LTGIRDTEIDDRGCATGKRGLGAPFEVVGRNRAHEREFEVGMRVDAARHDIAPAGIDRFGARRRFEVDADCGDRPLVEENVSAVIVVNDAAAAYEDGHVYVVLSAA
jgi:hypothetical protein